MLSTPGGRDSAPPAWGAEGATLPGTSQVPATEGEADQARLVRRRAEGASTMTDRLPLAQLERAAPFAERHIGPSADEQAKMLAVVGYGSLEELVADDGKHLGLLV